MVNPPRSPLTTSGAAGPAPPGDGDDGGDGGLACAGVDAEPRPAPAGAAATFAGGAGLAGTECSGLELVGLLSPGPCVGSPGLSSLCAIFVSSESPISPFGPAWAAPGVGSASS